MARGLKEVCPRVILGKIQLTNHPAAKLKYRKVNICEYLTVSYCHRHRCCRGHMRLVIGCLCMCWLLCRQASLLPLVSDTGCVFLRSGLATSASIAMPIDHLLARDLVLLDGWVSLWWRRGCRAGRECHRISETMKIISNHTKASKMGEPSTMTTRTLGCRLPVSIFRQQVSTVIFQLHSRRSLGATLALLLH